MMNGISVIFCTWPNKSLKVTINDFLETSIIWNAPFAAVFM